MRSKSLVIAAAFFVLGLGAARADVITLGSPLSFGGTNLPGACTNTTCSDTVVGGFGTPALIDGGALSLTETETSDGHGGDYVTWHLSTVGGGPLAGDINGNWNLVMNYTLNQAVNFTAAAHQWTVNGTPVSPLFNFSGICCATASNPILPGEAYYDFGFTAPLAAGAHPGWQEVFVDPYSAISEGGINPNTANGYNFGYDFVPQTAVPEPASLALLGTALLGLALVRRRKQG